jgi:hypothetical protein
MGTIGQEAGVFRGAPHPLPDRALRHLFVPKVLLKFLEGLADELLKQRPLKR